MSVVNFDRKGLFAFFCAFSVLSIVGCSDDDDSDPPPATNPNPAQFSNHSHNTGDKVYGNRTITFSLDVTDETTVDSVTMQHNGSALTVTNSGDTYSATITLEDRNNNEIIISANDGVSTVDDTVTLNYPYLTFTNGQAASVVIGQAGFNGTDANRGGSTAANGLSNPGGIIVVNDKLYIADTGNHRILGYNSIPTGDQNADFVIGQLSTDANISGLAADQLKNPLSISSDGNKLFVSQGASTGGGNVHIWNTVPLGHQAADNIIGESGFGVETNSCNDFTIGFNSTGSADSVYVVDGKVIVADTANNRVLIWNSIPTENGVSADVVLGQDSFTECLANDVNHNGVDDDTGLSASTLYTPFGIWSDGTRLAVVDANNFRVLIWNSFPTTNAQPADIVLGQTEFDVSFFNINLRTAINFAATSITSNGNQFFAHDLAGKRILIWDSFPTSINQPANKVLGKIDLESNVDLNLNASVGRDSSLFAHDEHLFVSSATDNRALIFNPQ